MIPSCDQTGTPLHFHSSITSGSACLISGRTWASVLPRQSLNSLIRASINRDGDSLLVVAVVAVFAVAVFFILLAPRSLFFDSGGLQSIRASTCSSPVKNFGQPNLAPW